MKLLVLVAAVLSSAYCYVDVDPRDVQEGRAGGFRTFFFIRRLMPMAANGDRGLPFGAHRRLEAEENLTPFRSVLLVRRKPEETFGAGMPRAYSPESFIKDFLASHMRHVQSGIKAENRHQFNTDKIYNDLYGKTKKAVETKTKEKDLFVEDDIDSIIANVAKELAPPEETKPKSIGKTIGKTKKRIRRRFRKAKKAIGKGFKLNMMTVGLFGVVAVLSGYAGYCMKSRSTLESYMPLAK